MYTATHTDNSRGALRRLVLCLSAAIPLGGCEKPSHQKQQPEPVPVKVGMPDPATTAPAATAPAGWRESLSSRVNSARGWTSQQTKTLTTQATEIGATASSLTAKQIRAVYEKWETLSPQALEASRVLLNKSGSAIDSGLNCLAYDPKAAPKIQTTAVNFALKAVPVVREAKRYADARTTYQHALKVSNAEERQALIQKAKRDCLFTCLDAGLDVASLGSAGLVDTTAENADRVLEFLRLTVLLGEFPYLKHANLFDPALDSALRIPTVNRAMEEMLKFEFTNLGDRLLAK